MILDLRKFDDFPAQIRLEESSGRIKLSNDSLVEVKSVRVDLAIQQTAEEFFCQGAVKAHILLECARCLSQYAFDAFSETSFIVSSELTVAERSDVIDDEEYVFFKGDIQSVDISKPISQAIIAEVPMKPLCKEDCKGLCTSCGINLNLKKCDCKKEVTDPRWDGLKGLLPEDK